MKKLATLLFFLFLNSIALAATEKPNPIFLAGHNLTPTTYVLKQDQATLGPYAVAYGITDAFMVETSPWIIAFYNMPMIGWRYQVYSGGGFQFTWESMFFKTFKFNDVQMWLVSRPQYQQSSTFQRLTGSYQFSPEYTLHLNFGYQFFWDHTYPYSFIPGDYRGNAVLSTSVLNEIHFNPHWGSFLEAGILGINYGDEGPDPVSAQVEHHVTPFLHFGISVFYTSDNWLIQLGASRSQGTISTTKPNPNRWIEPDDGNEVIFHPEIQLQWVF